MWSLFALVVSSLLCSFVVGDESSLLLSFFNSTGGSEWIATDGWLPDTVVCPPPAVPWFGVTCTGNHVSSIKLNHNNLNGSLDSNELFSLTELVSLQLDNNSLSWTSAPMSIPSVLRQVSVANNKVDGGVLSIIQFWQQLQPLPHPFNYLNLSGNAMTGTISNLLALADLRLSHNKLTGSLPVSLVQNIHLKVLQLQDNFLTGPLPTALNHTTIDYPDLDLSDNSWDCPLPSFPSLSGANMTCVCPESCRLKGECNSDNICISCNNKCDDITTSCSTKLCVSQLARCSNRGKCSTDGCSCECNTGHYGNNCGITPCPGFQPTDWVTTNTHNQLTTNSTDWGCQSAMGHGTCQTRTGICACAPYWNGASDCSELTCPKNCTDSEHGTCYTSTGWCHCSKEFLLKDCSLKNQESDTTNGPRKTVQVLIFSAVGLFVVFLCIMVRKIVKRPQRLLSHPSQYGAGGLVENIGLRREGPAEYAPLRSPKKK
eukprot:372783_1